MVAPTRSATVERLLERHRQEAQRLREDKGDPVGFIAEAVRDSFDAESLAAAFRELTEGESFFDDEADER
jgi:hypothetical protein